MYCKTMMTILMLSIMGCLSVDAAVNVKDFGACGDGKTDDTSAINRAIAAAYAPECVDRSIFFPPGNYRITATITLLPEHSGLTVFGARSGSGAWIPPVSRLVWDGESGGTMFDLRAMKCLRMEQLIVDGTDKAGKLVRINSIDSKNQDPGWMKKYGQRASTGHNFNYVTFCRAKVGVSLNDDAYICADCSSFVDVYFEHLDIGIDARSEQNLCYLLSHVTVGWVNTAFRFNGGGAVDAIGVNTHHVDVVFDISKCGINSGVYNLSNVRTEQGGNTAGKRPVMLKVAGEANVNLSAAETTCNALFGKDADLTTPAFILGPSANVLVNASHICGAVADLTGKNGDVPTFITFQNCRFRCFSDPLKSIKTDSMSGFRLRDCQISRDEERDGKYKIVQRDFVADYYKSPELKK